METLLACLVGFGVTLFFVARYQRSIPSNRKVEAPAAVATPTQPCPRCGKGVALDAGFCPSCGAPLALWNVHRATVRTGGASETPEGKPRPVISATLCIGCGSCVDVCPESGTLALSGGKAILVNPALCVGHARCVEVCPTSAISLARGNILQTLRVPMVREDFESNVAGLFIVGELGGMGLIKTAINEGRLAADSVRRRLEAQGISRAPGNGHGQPEHASPDTLPDGIYDVAIVGAGPAGLSASLCAQQYGIHYLTLERGEVAATIRQYPRHKFLMSEPVEMPLYGSLYVGDGTKESLLSVWEAIIANTGVKIHTNEGVEAVLRDPQTGAFTIRTARGSYRARFVILAMGKRGVPRRLGVPGEHLGKVAYRLIEAEEYEGRDILIVGGGDSAIEAALAVSKAGRNRVTLSYRGENFRKARQRNLEMMPEREMQGHLRVLRSSQVVEIRPECVVLSQNNQRSELANDFVFIMIGGESPESFLRKTGVEIVERVLTA